MPSPLRGLQLNCILAPVVTALIGVLALLWAWHIAWGDLRASERQQHQATLAGQAHLLALGQGADPATWLMAHPGWQGLSQMRMDGDRLVILASAGLPPPREPAPELILAAQTPISWKEGELCVSAAPVQVASGLGTVLAGWWEPAPAPAPTLWLVAMALVAVAGGGLGLYLVRRVYRPVLALEHRVALVASGGQDPGDEASSPETESLRSSIATLIERSRHG